MVLRYLPLRIIPHINGRNVGEREMRSTHMNMIDQVMASNPILNMNQRGLKYKNEYHP